MLTCALVAALTITTSGTLAALSSEAQATPKPPSGWVLISSPQALGNLPAVKQGKMLGRQIHSLKSTANGRDVSAELGYSGSLYGMLRARAAVVASWERFRIYWQASTGSWLIYSTANNRYVSAELGYTGGYYGMLRARATAALSWEQFLLYRNVGTGQYAILSKANGRWVSAELGYSGSYYGMLRARATAIASWEQFSIS